MRASEKPWTSAGVSAGIDLAVEAINDLADRELCAAIEGQMEWRQRWISSSVGEPLTSG